MSTEIDAAKCQRVAERIGVWKPGQKCPELNTFGRYPASCKHGVPWANHDLSCPDLSSPAMVVAMLEWLIQFLKDHPEDRSWADVGAYTVYEDRPLHTALIDAIDALAGGLGK